MTTATAQRWWAPAEAGIGPDDFDLVLLEPGDDGKKDLAQAFLAMHRVGAAACEAVATQPLADESTLAFALANARAQVAPKASGIVSKAVGDDPNYGNLLIRDVLDDAEAAALSLWRSCMASQVPAPLAAQRVGMVYGVPSGALMTFQKAATDVKTPPAVLYDLADRALFTYVSKLVEDEGQDRKVEVSKESWQEYNRTEQGAEHPKDDVGRFARSAAPMRMRRVAGQAARIEPEYEEPEPEEDTGARLRPELTPRPPERARRAQRVQRAQRAKPAQATRGRLKPHSVRHGTRHSLEHQINVQLQRQQMAEEGHDVPPNPNLESAGFPIGQRAPGDVTAPLPNTMAYARHVDAPLAVTLPTAEMKAFVDSAPKGETTGVFRAGHLEQYAGSPEVFRHEEEPLSNEHMRRVSQVVDTIKASPEYRDRPAPRIWNVDKAEIEAQFDPEIAKREAKLAFLREEVGLSDAQARRELTFVDDADNFDDPTGQITLVYAPAGPRGAGARRPVPSITELILREDELFGHNDAPDESPEQWHLEPSQPMRFESTAAHGQRFWDNELGTFRVWRYAVATDEDDLMEGRTNRPETAKAMTPERFHALEAAGVYQRDETGEFTAAEAEEAPEEVPAVKPEVRRAVRAQRVQRAARAQPPVERQRVTHETRHSTRRGTRHELRHELDIREGPDEDGLVIFGPSYHTVVPAHIHLGPGFMTKTPSLKAQEEIDAQPMAYGDETDLHIKGVTLDKRFRHNVGMIPVLEFSDVTHEGLEDVAGALWREMEKDPNFALADIRVRYHPEDETVDVQIRRNQHPLGAVDVIRWDDTNRARPYHVAPDQMGRMHSVRTMRRYLMGLSAEAERNPGHLVREQLANPVTRVWRAEQL